MTVFKPSLAALLVATSFSIQSCGTVTRWTVDHPVPAPKWDRDHDLIRYRRQDGERVKESWQLDPQTGIATKSPPPEKKPRRSPHLPKLDRTDRTDPLHHARSSRVLKTAVADPHGRNAAFVKSGNVHVVNLETGRTDCLTGSTSDVHVYGRPDWVATEEFRQSEGLWWAPDGKALAFYETDSRPVEAHRFTRAGKGRETYRQRYPYAGRTNSIVSLHVHDLETGKTTAVALDRWEDSYLIQPRWSLDGTTLFALEVNRLQNHRRVHAWQRDSGTVRIVVEEESETFVNADQEFRPLASGGFLWGHEETGWRGVDLVDSDGKRRPVIRGRFDVARILHVNEDAGTVHFTAWTDLGRDLHLFRGSLDGDDVRRLTEEPGVHNVSISPSGSWFIDRHSSFTRPERTDLRTIDGGLVSTLKHADPKVDSTRPEWFSFLADDHKTRLSGVLYRPANHDPKKSYPLLVSVYGGPHSRVLRNVDMTGGRLQHLADMGMFVAKFDNRGLRGRGKKFESATYLKLGRVDIDDQAAGVRYLLDRGGLDRKRIGITGHSYGGYMSCLALARHPDLFHVGLAGAPVTDWRFYDTIYTERYMRTPALNPEGYQLSSVVNLAGRIRGHLLIGHGGSDDNVHIENSLELVKALGDNPKIVFETYPDSFHGFRAPDRIRFEKKRQEMIRQHLLSP